MKKIAIYGAGGFGREVYCLIQKINAVSPQWDVIGFFDDGKPKGDPVGHYGSILGAIADVNAWREPLEIVRLCRFITFRRPGFPLPSPEELKFPPDIACQLLAQIIDGPLFDISSSDIRIRAARGESLDRLVPHPVAEYISANNLYRP